jgi:predicted transcriptional regulator
MHVMENPLDKELKGYLKRLNDAEKKSVLLMLKTFLHGRSKGRRISADVYNQELDEAMKEVTRGEVYSHEDVVDLSKAW